ncbi:Transposon Ty3-I Gag-Pol polyprotein [Dictyocoela muelleri]|nr:Transposon Ty3-I Gag-Pol polyprotein [Dictyocoela muelleri]
MNDLFKDIPDTIIYLDDILIYNISLEKHYNSLLNVFRILKENNVSINFEKKSKFAVETIEFLGHQISANEIQPNITKITDMTFKKPKTKKQLQKILGLLNWYRPFVKSLSIKLYDLNSLLNKKLQQCNGTKYTPKFFME